MSVDREQALTVAVEAVRAASVVCRKVQANLVAAEAVQKKDKSPVTVGDFAAQAVICQALERAFPALPVVGEEHSAALRSQGADSLRAAVVRHVATVVPEGASEESVLGWIDHGDWTPDGSARAFWTLDPIDGTKGFLRGEQYAIALALIEGGKVVLGVLGCPNLAVDPAGGSGGLLLAASRGKGCRMLRLESRDAGGQPVHVSPVAAPSQARFCESVESGHSDQEASARIAASLAITAEPYRIDSQCKYAAVARGDASIYLRLPTRADYRETIWDHAAGVIVVEEAGGTVTDALGRPLDFARGRKLEANQGIIATNGRFHDRVVAAVRPELKHV